MTACNGITNRANQFTRVLANLERLVTPQITTLANIVREEGMNYKKYSLDSKKKIAALLTTMKVIKALLDTPLLNEKGALTAESEEVLLKVNKEMRLLK